MSSPSNLAPGESGYSLPLEWNRAIVLKDFTVNVSLLSATMCRFLNVCHQVHKALFDVPLCVTSGNDGGHAPNSKHSKWKAVDIRSSDIDVESQLVFMLALLYLSRPYSMAVFDERCLPGAGHFHVEEAG